MTKRRDHPLTRDDLVQPGPVTVDQLVLGESCSIHLDARDRWGVEMNNTYHRAGIAWCSAARGAAPGRA